jgi:transposase-like protein
MAKALEQWSLEAIEAALGDDAVRVLPEAIRTCELRARMPRYQVAMLEHLAELEGATVSGVLTRELEDVASAHAEVLSAAIPGFAAALAWPRSGDSQQVC